MSADLPEVPEPAPAVDQPVVHPAIESLPEKPQETLAGSKSILIDLSCSLKQLPRRGENSWPCSKNRKLGQIGLSLDAQIGFSYPKVDVYTFIFTLNDVCIFIHIFENRIHCP